MVTIGDDQQLRTSADADVVRNGVHGVRHVAAVRGFGRRGAAVQPPHLPRGPEVVHVKQKRRRCWCRRCIRG